jgi:hypothetical protein
MLELPGVKSEIAKERKFRDHIEKITVSIQP